MSKNITGDSLPQIDPIDDYIQQIKSAGGKMISLEDQGLTEIPKILFSFNDLEILALPNNNITIIPPWIRSLKKLRLLYLHGNKIRHIASDIGSLPNLEALYLQDNNLTDIPNSLANSSKLTELYLHNNTELGIPDEILGPTWKETSKGQKRAKSPGEILDYFSKIKGRSGKPLNECKLIIVGRGGAGKTSLVKRLSGQNYSPNEPETHGITISKLAIECDEDVITARIWDFGGQVILHSMHEFFLTERSLYLLVLGERDDMLERDAQYWLQLIRSYAGNAPVIVVLNKSSGRHRDFDRQLLEKDFGPILGWVCTECSEPDPEKAHINELHTAIRQALSSPYLDSVRRKFPDKWISVKEEIDNMEESFLERSTFEEKCALFGVVNRDEQDSLANDLHDLGVALSYERDPRLRDTTVLRPDWLANGIYAILRANDIDKKSLPPYLKRPLAPDGIIDDEILTLIYKKAAYFGNLADSEYPPERRGFLLRLMALFNICYPLEGGPNRYLVPSLLSFNPPSDSIFSSYQNKLQLRYELKVVPSPIIPWFISRTYSLIPDRSHWRRGTYLIYGSSMAKVHSTLDDRYIFIDIAWGDIMDAKEITTITRGTFEDIFGHYSSLAAIEQIRINSNWIPLSAFSKSYITPDGIFELYMNFEIHRKESALDNSISIENSDASDNDL